MSLVGTVRPPRRTSPPGEARARLIWCGLIVALLALQVVTGLAAVTLASADASFAVVPGYHEQALRWDETQAAARKSASLGWTDELQAATEADVLGRRLLSVELRDRAGRHITGANVKALVFHHARANESQKTRFVEIAHGKYQAELLMRQSGLWEVRLDATRGGNHFVATRTLEVRPPGGRE